MPLTMKYSETYNDALIALAAATHRPANVVNLFGEYAIRVDLEYNRFLLATNTAAGLSDRPDNGESWLVRFFQSENTDTPDRLLAEASHQWLVDALGRRARTDRSGREQNLRRRGLRRPYPHRNSILNGIVSSSTTSPPRRSTG